MIFRICPLPQIPIYRFLVASIACSQKKVNSKKSANPLVGSLSVFWYGRRSLKGSSPVLSIKNYQPALKGELTIFGTGNQDRRTDWSRFSLKFSCGKLLILKMQVQVPSRRKKDSPPWRVNCLFWYGRQDLNLHGHPPEPKSGASANSATPAQRCLL